MINLKNHIEKYNNIRILIFFKNINKNTISWNYICQESQDSRIEISISLKQ